MTPSKSMALALLGIFLLVAPAAGQQAADPGADVLLTPAALDALVADHVFESDAGRQAIEDFLGRDEVRDVAEDRGIDLDRLSGAATTLSDEEVRRLAPLVADAEAAMQRGGTITISVYTIIIVLLLLILLT